MLVSVYFLSLFVKNITGSFSFIRNEERNKLRKKFSSKSQRNVFSVIFTKTQTIVSFRSVRISLGERMASKLMSRECDSACKEETEFLLKFIITSLTLTDNEASEELNDILVVITFDGNVIKIEDFESNADGNMKYVGRQLTLQMSPEMFSKKLRTCPIMLDLSRGCTELGTLKVQITDCFADAVKCEEFSSEATTNEFNFVKDEVKNASMIMILEVSRPTDDETSTMTKNLYGGYAKKKSEIAKKKLQETLVKAESEDVSLSSNSGSNTSCETDLCPIDEDSNDRQAQLPSLCRRQRNPN